MIMVTFSYGNPTRFSLLLLLLLLPANYGIDDVEMIVVVAILPPLDAPARDNGFVMVDIFRLLSLFASFLPL